MTNGQDTNSQAEAQPGESLKNVAPNKISSLPEKDALSDSDLEVSGGGAYPPFFSKGIVTGAGG
jgi:hypothetical protein